MKICKDPEGYFVLDDANQKVNLFYKGEVVVKLPTIMHLGLTYWHSNEKGNKVTTPFEVLVNDIRHFKAIRFEILEYLIKAEL